METLPTIPAGPGQKGSDMRPRLTRRSDAWARLQRLAREEQGAELVEFSLSILILMNLFFCVIYFSFGMYSYIYAANAAQEGTRFAMVHGATWTTACNTQAPPNFTMKYDCQASSADVQNFLRATAPPGIEPLQVTVTTSWPGTTADCSSGCAACTTPQNKGCMVQVLVSYSYFLIPILSKSPALTFPLKSTSEQTITQ